MPIDSISAEDRFHLLINAVTDYAIYMLDPDGVVTTWNPGAERLKGYGEAEIAGQHFSRFFTAEDLAAELPQRSLRIAAREGRFEAEGQRVRKDGSTFWAHVVIDPIRGKDGELLGFAKITRDVTAERESKEALRASEHRFQLLVNSVDDYAIYMLDPMGHVSTWNAGARRFKGYEADEIMGDHFSRFFTPEDRRAGVPAQILRTAAKEDRFETEAWRVRKDGSRFLAHVVIHAIKDENGEMIGFAKVTRDITGRRENQKVLFESEQRFKLLVQGVKDYAIYMLDCDGNITNWNSGAQAIKGYREEEVIGRHFSCFYTEEDRANGEPERALATARQQGKFETEAWRVRKDGSLFWAHVLLDPIYDESGKQIGYAKITRDTTDRRKAMEELEEARVAVAQSQKLQALGELTGGIAHDFNNLMTVIAGSSDFLLRKPDLPEEKRQQYLRSIVDTAERATALTSHLLAFSRRQSIRPQVIDVNVRLDALGDVLTRTLGSRIEVTLDLASDLPHVDVDPAEFETAVLNAAFNARDAMPEGGRLTVRTRAPDADEPLVRIEIEDSGTGMPKAVMDRAFDPFFTTKEIGKGTGLGLSQIHGFAAQAAGRATIQSQPGEGTTVSIMLPASTGTPAEADAEREDPALPAGLRILLVEDNAQVRDFARNLLADMHCLVVAADDGEQALVRAEAEPFDLVLSDVVMPRMDGLELARVLKDRRPDLPVILASGYSDQIVGGAAADFYFIRKPYDSASLGEAISEVLGQQGRQAD